MDADSKRIKNAAAIGLAATVVVVAVKIVAAWISGSVSVLGEALQSTLDIVMSGITLAAVGYASRPADKSHPYGHGKAEFISSAVQMLLVLATSGWILFLVVERARNPVPIRWDVGAWAMGYALASNLLAAAYIARVARETGSAALQSEVVHLRSDSIASAGVLLGMVLVGATGVLWLDPATAVVTTLLSIYLAVGQLKIVAHSLMDGSLPEGDVATIESVLNQHPQVRGYHNLRTRAVGRDRFIDLHVLLDDSLSFVDAHDLAETIEDELRECLGGAVVSIHYEPAEAETAHREQYH